MEGVPCHHWYVSWMYVDVLWFAIYAAVNIVWGIRVHVAVLHIEQLCRSSVVSV